MKLFRFFATKNKKESFKNARVFLIIFAIVLISYFGLISNSFGDAPEMPKPSKPATVPDYKPPIPDPGTRKPEFFSLSIVEFRTSTPYPGIALGDEETLNWDIRGNNVKNLRVEITPDVGVINLTRTDYTGESFRIEGSRKVRPSRNTTYTVRVTGDGIGLGGVLSRVEKTKTVLVTVRRPKLENVQPVVDQRNLKIKFIVKNTGDADFRPTPINVYYQIQGKGGIAAPTILREGSFTSSRIGIAAGAQAEVGEVTLSDRRQAFSHDELQIIVDVGASYVLPLEGDRDTFTHMWTPAQFTLNETLIDIFGSLVRGSIRLNNFDGSSGVIRHNPYRSNDSYIEIMGIRRTFSPPRLDFSSGILDYRYFINNLNATFGGRNLFSIQDGKLKLSISFETAGTEIRGYEETWGVWHDVSAPDVDIQRFDVTVSFIPGLRGGRISYTGVETSSDVRVTFLGLYEILPERWERYLENEIKNRIRAEITSILMNDDIRRRIEDAIADAINRLPITITRIIEVKGEGNTIKIKYL